MRDFTRRRRPWLAALPLLVILIVADRSGCLLVRRPDDLAAYHGVTATVARVIDADEIEVEIADPLAGRGWTRVRLWGVESEEPGPPWLAAGARVTLRLEPGRTRDPLADVLAHVELPDGTCVNERLLAEGLARVDERWPHTRLGRYGEIERAARLEGRGVWKDRGN